MLEYCFKYLKEIFVLDICCSDSNKYPKHIFYEEIRTKLDISDISICSFSILYNGKFILMPVSSRTNAVVVMRVYCNLLTVPATVAVGL